LPTVDHICRIINAFEGPVLLYKIDLARAFRQVSIDPLDVVNLGIEWESKVYLNTALPFSFRHGSGICQRITDAVRFILSERNITVVNYIDDFIAIVPEERANEMFEITKSIFNEIGMVINEEKTVAPTEICNCLGIIIHTKKHIFAIPEQKLKSIITICKQFQKFKILRKQQIQSILGLLIYVHKAIRPARLFVNRIIALLRIAPTVGFVHIGQDFKRDLEWFCRFAQVYNGWTRFDKALEIIDFEVYADASLKGIGACVNNHVYHHPIEGDGSNIAYWEALNVLVALRTWAEKK
jgi:hypothetical protein